MKKRIERFRCQITSRKPLKTCFREKLMKKRIESEVSEEFLSPVT